MAVNKSRHVQVFVSNDDYLGVIFLPERVLVAAILERATRDLSDATEHYWRLQAIQWFRAEIDELDPDNRFSFEDCQSVLELSGWQLKFLEEKVIKAEIYEAQRKEEAIRLGEKSSTYQTKNQFKAERFPRRAYVSYISKGMRNRFRAEDGTILRKYG